MEMIEKYPNNQWDWREVSKNPIVRSFKFQ